MENTLQNSRTFGKNRGWKDDRMYFMRKLKVMYYYIFYCSISHLNWTWISKPVDLANICKWSSDFFVVAWLEKTHCEMGSQKFSIFSLLPTWHVTMNKSLSVCVCISWRFHTELTSSVESERLGLGLRVKLKCLVVLKSRSLVPEECSEFTPDKSNLGWI